MWVCGKCVCISQYSWPQYLFMVCRRHVPTEKAESNSFSSWSETLTCLIKVWEGKKAFVCKSEGKWFVYVCVSEGKEDGWKAVDRVCLNRELLWRITVPLIRTREEIERRKWERERGQADVNMSLRSTGFVWPAFGLNPLLGNATIQGEL